MPKIFFVWNMPSSLGSTPKDYRTLIIREHDRWTIQFGDYDKQTVVQERRDSYTNIRRCNWRIIKTTDQQKEIDERVRQINS
jgi:hypothetical protein